MALAVGVLLVHLPTCWWYARISKIKQECMSGYRSCNNVIRSVDHLCNYEHCTVISNSLRFSQLRVLSACNGSVERSAKLYRVLAFCAQQCTCGEISRHARSKLEIFSGAHRPSAKSHGLRGARQDAQGQSNNRPAAAQAPSSAGAPRNSVKNTLRMPSKVT